MIEDIWYKEKFTNEDGSFKYETNASTIAALEMKKAGRIVNAQTASATHSD